MSRQASGDQGPILWLQKPEEIHELTPDEASRLLVESFRFSQGRPSGQTIFFRYLHEAYPKMYLPDALIDETLTLAKQRIIPLTRSERHQRSIPLDTIETTTARHLAEMQRILAGEVGPEQYDTREEVLDEFLTHMIIYDYYRLFENEAIFSEQAAQYATGRRRTNERISLQIMTLGSVRSVTMCIIKILFRILINPIFQQFHPN